MTRLAAPNSVKSEEDEKTKRKQEVSGCVGWGKASRSTQISMPRHSPARQSSLPGPVAGTGRREEQAWKGDGRKRPRWKTGSREEKPLKDARLNKAFLAKEQGRNKDDLAWTKALREGME